MSATYTRPRDEAEKVERRLARYPEAVRLTDEGTARPKVAEAVGLLREGLHGLEIAEVMGLSRSMVYQLLKDPTDELNQARKRRHHGTCEDCGGPTFNGGSVQTPKRCRDCEFRRTHENSVAWLVAEIHHWFDLYGEVPAAYCFEPSNMRWQRRAYDEGRNSGRPSLANIREIERRHAEDGPWPARNTFEGVFGSWNAAVVAAGFEPLAVGHKRNGRRA